MSAATVSEQGGGVTVAKRAVKHKVCPSCRAEETVVERRHAGRFVVGLIVTILCGLLAVPTLGVSAIFMIWGVMQMVKIPTCTACGWHERLSDSNRR